MTVSIEVEHISKQYQLGRELDNSDLQGSIKNLVKVMLGREGRKERQAFKALDDVSLKVNEGEIVGIVGHNGSGKSTLLKIISRITAPTSGKVTLRGRVGSLLEVGTGFHAELTGRENIYVNGSILGMSQAEIDRHFDEIVAFADIGNFLDTPVKRYSSGMYVRLAFAVAAHLQPEILLVDEVLAVGDANFQKKCLGKMGEIGASGRTVVFVSHNLQAIMRLCSRAFLLDHGKLIAEGDPQTVIRSYLQSDNGGVAEKRYTPEDNPGNEYLRVNQVRVCDDDGNTRNIYEIQENINIEFDFEVLGQDRQMSPHFLLTNTEGIMLFRSHSVDEQSNQMLKQGRYISKATIPANLLAEGEIIVTASFASYIPAFTVHASMPEILSFVVEDRELEGGSRGFYKGAFVGVIRPKLSWNTIHYERRETMA